MDEQTYYELFGVDPESDREAIEGAYRAARSAAMPAAADDVETRDAKEQWARRLDEAWRVLGEPGRRERYDRWLAVLERDEPGPAPAERSDDHPVRVRLTADRVRPETPAAGIPRALTPVNGTARAATPAGGIPRAELPYEQMVRTTVRSPAAGDPPFAAPAEPSRAVAVRAPTPAGGLAAAAPARTIVGVQTIDVQGVPRATRGADLRRIREQRGVDLEAVASHTRIGIGNLRFIEADAYDQLPAAIYVRNFVRQYAAQLGLDPEDTARNFMSLYDNARS